MVSPRRPAARDQRAAIVSIRADQLMPQRLPVRQPVRARHNRAICGRGLTPPEWSHASPELSPLRLGEGDLHHPNGAMQVSTSTLCDLGGDLHHPNGAMQVSTNPTPYLPRISVGPSGVNAPIAERLTQCRPSRSPSRRAPSTTFLPPPESFSKPPRGHADAALRPPRRVSGAAIRRASGAAPRTF